MLVRLRRRVRAGRQLTLADFATELGTDGGPLAAYLISIPFLFPVSLGPITSPASICLGLLGAGMLRPTAATRLPGRLLRVGIPTAAFDAMRRWILGSARRAGRGRRLAVRATVQDQRTPRPLRRAAGILVVVGALLLLLPIPLLPLSNTLPALGIVLACAGLLKNSLLHLVASAGLMGFSATYFTAILVLGWEAIAAVVRSTFS